MRASTARLAWIAAGLAVWMLASRAAAEAPTILVSPMPHAGDTRATESDLAAQLVRRLEATAQGRAHAVLEPAGRGSAVLEANHARGLAAAAGAAYVLVGRWLPAASSNEPGAALEAALELRSGHSGATEHRYRLSWDRGPRGQAARQAEVARVSRAILEDLRLTRESQASAAVVPAPEHAESPGGKKRTDFLSVDRDQPIKIDADELEVISLGSSKHLIFSDHVHIVQGEMQLFAGLLKVIYPDGAAEPERLDASKNVRIIEGDLEIRCLEATYLRVDGLVICRGDALLMQGCDEVRGREIEFHLDEERVVVMGAASVVLRLDREDASNCESERAG